MYSPAVRALLFPSDGTEMRIIDFSHMAVYVSYFVRSLSFMVLYLSFQLVRAKAVQDCTATAHFLLRFMNAMMIQAIAVMRTINRTVRLYCSNAVIVYYL